MTMYLAALTIGLGAAGLILGAFRQHSATMALIGIGAGGLGLLTWYLADLIAYLPQVVTLP